MLGSSYKNIKSRIVDRLRGRWTIFDGRSWIFLYDNLTLLLAIHITSFMVLEDPTGNINTGITLKCSLVFSLITSAFFFWFQTYKGIWRYFSWRQAFLFIGVLGIASLIFWPLFMKITGILNGKSSLFVAINWIVATTLVSISRLGFRLFYDHWSQTDEAELASSPVARLVLVGMGEKTKNFIQIAKQNTPHLYEILGIVEDHPRFRGGHFQGIPILGGLEDLPDLIENFNLEVAHPHHIVLMEEKYIGKKARDLVQSLYPYKVSFMKEHRGELLPLNLEDIFGGLPENIEPNALEGKVVLVLGATSALGKPLVQRLLSKKAKDIILWDAAPRDLGDLIEKLGTAPIKILPQSVYAPEALASYLKEQKVDVVFNLRAFQASEIEHLETALTLRTYINENEQIVAVCGEADVKNYIFVAQRAPHYKVSNSLIPVAGEILRNCLTSSVLKNRLVILPTILHQEDRFLKTTALSKVDLKVSQKYLSVVTPEYGAFLLESCLMANAGDICLDFSASGEQVPYNDLINFYMILTQETGASLALNLELQEEKELVWDKEIYQEVRSYIENMKYSLALNRLGALYH